MNETRTPQAARILFGGAVVLLVLYAAADIVLGRTANADLLRFALVLTAVFAVAGAVFGLRASLKSRR